MGETVKDIPGQFEIGEKTIITYENHSFHGHCIDKLCDDSKLSSIVPPERIVGIQLLPKELWVPDWNADQNGKKIKTYGVISKCPCCETKYWYHVGDKAAADHHKYLTNRLSPK